MSANEFTVLIALLMSIVALAIDALLPALTVIGAELQLRQPNDAQYIISFLFFGMAFGQLVCGPLSDALGRKRVLYIGFVLFLVGSGICLFADRLSAMLVGRAVQGFGAAGPYVSAISIVRDKYSGRQMARIMSLVMLVFFLVPAVAPAVGQLILTFGSWRWVFAMYICYASVILAWIHLRLEETLPQNRRIPFRARALLMGLREVVSNRVTTLNMLCIGLFFGGFIGYLNSAQQIFQVQYNEGARFALYFGLLALILGSASLVNSRMVERLGMRHLCQRANFSIVLACAIFLIVNQFPGGTSLTVFLIYAGVLFLCFGFLFGNLNAMAMEPVGHLAGIASAIIGFFSSVLAISIGTWIGQLYNGTITPLAVGFLILSSLSLLIMRLGEAGRAKVVQET